MEIESIKKQIEELKPEIKTYIEELEYEMNDSRNLETVPIEDSKIKYFLEQFEWMLTLYDSYLNVVQPYIPYETNRVVEKKEYADFDEESPESIVYKPTPNPPKIRRIKKDKNIKNWGV